jgi:MFS family permease
MLALGLFRSRGFSAGNAATLLTTAALYAAVFFIAQFFQTGLDNDPLGAGLRLLPWTATLFFVAPVAGKLVDRFGERPFLVTGLALQALGFAWIALRADPGISYISLVPALMLAGCGVSMAIPSSQIAAVGSVEPAQLGQAAGANTMLRQFGGVLGIAVAVAVFSGAGGYVSPQAFSDGFKPAMAVAAALSLTGAATGLVLPRRRRTTTTFPEPALEASA